MRAVDKPGDLSISIVRESFGRKEVDMIPLAFLTLLFTQPLYEMEEVVVTATRYPAALKDVALATVVIEREDIEKLSPQSIGEVLHAYAGIDVKDYGSSGSVSSIVIRGIPSNGTLILLNNQPLNSITTGMADLNTINVNTVERIEIVKGPVSSLYGANGLGGVVNIVTTKNYAGPEIELKIMPSTTDPENFLQSGHIFGSAGIPFGTTHIGIKGAYLKADGHRSNSDLNQYHFQSACGQQIGQFHIDAVLTYGNKEYGVPGPLPIVDSLHPIPHFGDSSATSLLNREHDNFLLGNVKVDWNVTDHLRWFTTLHGDRKILDFHQVYTGWFGDTVIEDYNYLTHTVGLQSLAAVTVDNVEFVFGIDACYDTLETRKESKQTGDTLWSASSYLFGGWFEFKKRFGTVTAIPRIRFDRNSDYGNFVSPGFGVVSHVIENFWVKMSLGKAFRAPAFNDLYWPDGGNPDLKPEHGWEYELRLESAPIPNIFSALSIFLRSIKDRIVWLPTEELWQPQNADHLLLRGVDLEVRSQINDVLGFTLEATYLHALQKNNEIVYDFYDFFADTGRTIIEEIQREAAFTPKYRISASLNMKAPHDVALFIRGLFVGEQSNYYPNYDSYPDIFMDVKKLDRYFVLDAHVYKTLFNYLTISVGVKNLLDAQYAMQFGYSIDDLDYPMQGRTLFAQVGWQYR